MKNFTAFLQPSLPKDINHKDGSKSYGNINGGYITIKRPEVVVIVDSILDKDYRGWSYMPILIKLREDEIVTLEEFSQIMRILD